MEFTTEAKDRTIKELLDKFNGYCNPKKNVTVERHKFFMRSQEPNENIDQYATELRSLAASCDFGNLKDSLIKDRIVCGILEHSVKERLLREPDLDLNKALQICRASELSKKQVKSIGSVPSAVHALNKRRVKGYNKSKIVKKRKSLLIPDLMQAQINVASVGKFMRRINVLLLAEPVTNVRKIILFLMCVDPPRKYMKLNVRAPVVMMKGTHTI